MSIDFFLDFDFDSNAPVMSKSVAESDEKLLSDIRDVARQMEVVKSRFEFESDGDLVEATIYEMESLNARYRYLIKLAKARNMKSAEIGSLYVANAG